MKKNFKLGVIGGGFMAQAIIDGILNGFSNNLKPKNIMVSDISDEMLSKYADKKINTTKSNLELIEFADFVLFAVKPQSLNSVIEELKGKKPERIITIMAGVTKQRLKTVFGDVKVARCMPNTPCSIGSGVVAIDLSDFDEEEKDFITSLFDSIAEIVLLDESKMNAVTGISGSGPAYVYLFIDSLIEAGKKHGLTFEEAKILAVNTVYGGAEMIINNPEKDIKELIKAVCSKGGTTIEAMKKFEENNFYDIVDKSVTACVNRAEELSKQC